MISHLMNVELINVFRIANFKLNANFNGTLQTYKDK